MFLHPRKNIPLGQFREERKLGGGRLSKITNRKTFLDGCSKLRVQLTTEPHPHLPTLPPKRPRFFFFFPTQRGMLKTNQLQGFSRQVCQISDLIAH